MIPTLLAWAESTSLGHFMRESGPWTYAIVNVVHVLGIAAVFGSVAVIDLRLLGVGRRLSIASLAAATTPVTVVGLVLALASGSALLCTKATAYIGNPFLLIKFPAIGLGLLNAVLLRLSPAWKAGRVRDLSGGERRQLGVMAAISLSCWLTAIVAGRMLGYW